MAIKSLSRTVIPEPVLASYRQAAPAGWDIVVVAWAIAACLAQAGALIAELSGSFQYGIDYWFTDLLTSYLAVWMTLFIVTLLVRLGQRKSPDLVELGFMLFALIGALWVVIGIIGIFVAFNLNGLSNVFAAEMSHIGGIVLGVVLIVWSVGEAAAASSGPRAAGGTRSAFEQLLPASLLSRGEMGATWELTVVGFVVAAWLFTIGAFVSSAGATSLAALGGTAGLVLVFVVSRARSSAMSDFGRFCTDLAALLAAALGAVMLVAGVIVFFDSFSNSGAGNVVGGMLHGVAVVVLGALTAVWGVIEIAHLRDMPAVTGLGQPTGGPATSGPTVVMPPPSAPPGPLPPVAPAGGADA